MRRVGNRTLWIGNAGDLRDHSSLTEAGIAAIVELDDAEPMAALPREFVRLRFPLSDGGENPEWLLHLAARTLDALLRADVSTLICCSAGMSRSVCIAAGGIALAEGRTLAEALKESGAFAADVSPALFLQLRKALGA